MSDNSITINLVGDIQPNRPEPETLFQHVQELLADGDLNLAQLECTVSDKGLLLRDVRNPAHRVPPENVKALTAAPFHGVTFAGNNNLDYGVEAFDDTLERLSNEGIFYVGAGPDLTSARASVIQDVRGVKVAFVNACSILPLGYDATSERPGIAPLAVKTYYDSLEKLHEQPGTPARTITVPDADDLAGILAEIEAARDEADIVIACFHWGVHFTHDLAQYQAEVGYAAIDAGADIVVGTHPHCLQGIDTYKGKPIFYSLGNFAFEQPGEIAMEGAGSYLKLYGMPADTSVPGHPHPDHCRPSVAVKIRASKGGIDSIDLIPTYLNDECQPEVVSPGSDRFERVKELLVDLSSEVGTEIVEVNGKLQIGATDEGLDARDLLRKRNISYPSLRHLSTETV